MNPIRLRRLTIALAWLLVAIAIPLYAFKVHQKADYMDFDVYYKAATRLKAQDWENLYSLRDGTSPFRYAPPVLPWLAPLAQLTRDEAKLVFYAVQVACFALTFALIHAIVRATTGTGIGTAPGMRRRPKRTPGIAGWATAFSLLFVLRLCLDTFTIGQITPILLVLITASAWAWTTRLRGRAHAGLSAALLVPPALIKIGPAVLYGVFLSTRLRQKLRAALAAAVTLWILVRGASLWLVSQGASTERLWSLWWVIVREDDRYYDASHYGSQSFKSALLRLANIDWISRSTAMSLYALGVVAGCAAVAAFWSLRRPRTLEGRALLFSSGLFPYFWLMPETFKYSLTPLALPVALLFSLERKSLLTWIGLGFGLLTLTLAGKDLVGDWLFFAIQRASLPFIATLLLGAACFTETWRRTSPSSFARWLSRLLARPGLEPWRKLPRVSPDEAGPQLSLLIPLSMDRTSSLNPGWLTRRTAELTASLESSLPPEVKWEALFIPFGDRVSRSHPLWLEAQAQCGESDRGHLRLLDPATCIEASLSRGLALREGFLEASGSAWIGFWNLEQPCLPEFFAQARLALQSSAAQSGLHLVRANRRHPQSRFQVPVRQLSLIYGRHRLGLIFNRLIHAMLPLSAPDTQAGSLLMTRELAERAFALQTSPHFLFDLEISLITRGAGWRELALPVTTRLPEEKKVRRMVRETLTIAASLPRLARRERLGFYGRAWSPGSSLPLRMTADDWGISPGVNQGVLHLSRRGVIRRTSLMARSSFLSEGLPELLRLRDEGKIELGLHFDLTFGRSSPSKVLLRWLTARLAGGSRLDRLRAEAREELASQLASLARLGVRPTYLDGHHHIHLVPGLLETLAEPLLAAGIRKVRVPYDPGLWLTPKFPLAWLARRALGVVRSLGLETHPCFYPALGFFFDPGRMRAALARHASSEVIVHPADRADFARYQIPDDYCEPRVTEYRALLMLGYLERSARREAPGPAREVPGGPA